MTCAVCLRVYLTNVCVCVFVSVICFCVYDKIVCVCVIPFFALLSPAAL